jgi:catechol 2,3-dioxygenase-like lactoylglutathione lyase family enzyme
MPYVDPKQQLVLEIYVANLDISLQFFQSFGFKPHRRDGGFAVVEWEGCQLFLAEGPGASGAAANIRVMVPDVDRYWDLAASTGTRVVSPIDDRFYGLRDFTVAGPDGIDLRFASWLEQEN